MRWPTNNFWLQTSSTLVPTTWLNATNAPTVSGHFNAVAVPPTEGAQYFRFVQSPFLPPPTELTVVPEEDDLGDTWFAAWGDAVPQAVSYNLYYAPDPSVTENNYAGLGGAVVMGITNTWVAVTNLLLTGQEYYFVVTAVATNGESADSMTASGLARQFADVSGSVSTLLASGTNTFQAEVPGVTITLSNLLQPQLSSQTTSDSNGYYGFVNQPAGVYQLCWSAPGFISGCLPDSLVITNVSVDGEDLALMNDGSPLIFGRVTLADGSDAVQSDSFFEIQESVSVSLGSRTVFVDDFGNYIMASLPPQIGATLSAGNGAVGVSTNIAVAGVQEVDFALPETPPGILALYATSNGGYITQAPQGTALQATVVATNSSGGTNGLHYTWIADSDNTNFTSFDSPTVAWTLSAVGGVQSLYVVVSDNLGGYATEGLQISTDLGLLFAGQVIDPNGLPIAGAAVSVNNQATNSDMNGGFTVLVTNLADTYAVVATLPGYVPFTALFGGEYQNVTCVMAPEPPCQGGNLTADFYAFDQYGTELFIPSNSVVSVSNGLSAALICVTLNTLDPCSAANQLGITPIGVLDGTNVALEFLAMADVRVVDQYGGPVVLTTDMQLTITADTNCLDVLTNEDASMWWYDEASEVWRQVGGVTTSTFGAAPPAFTGPAPKPGMVAPVKIRPGGPAQPPVMPPPVPVQPQAPPPQGFWVQIDKTISLPVVVRISDTTNPKNVKLVKSRTVEDDREWFFMTLPVTTPAVIEVLSPKEAPGMYPPTLEDANKAVIVSVPVPVPRGNGVGFVVGLSAQIPLIPPQRVIASDKFLTGVFGSGNPDTATKYYGAVDPDGKKSTFAKWLTANGWVVTNLNGVQVVQGDTASAVFFNACDLGFGREVHYKMRMDIDLQPDYALYVRYYGSAEDAATAADRNLFAIAAMDYVPHPAAPIKRETAFYLFDKAGMRVTSQPLVRGDPGQKFVPNACLVCHGGFLKDLEKLVNDSKNGKNKGAIVNQGDMKAHFIPFDLDSFTYADNNANSRKAQEAALKIMNLAVTNIDPTTAIVDLVNGWYAGAGGNFDGTYVPAKWKDQPAQAAAYSGAFAISCRSCHVTRQTQSFLSFMGFSDKMATPGGSPVYTIPGNDTMPNSLRPFTIFWGSQSANSINQPGGVAPPNQPAVLQKPLPKPAPFPSPSKFP